MVIGYGGYGDWLNNLQEKVGDGEGSSFKKKPKFVTATWHSLYVVQYNSRIWKNYL